MAKKKKKSIQYMNRKKNALQFVSIEKRNMHKRTLTLAEYERRKKNEQEERGQHKMISEKENYSNNITSLSNRLENQTDNQRVEAQYAYTHPNENIEEKTSNEEFIEQDYDSSSRNESSFYSGTLRKGDVVWAEMAFPNDPSNVKIRPVVILQSHIEYGPFSTFTVVPLTSKFNRDYLETHVIVSKNSMAIVECMTTIRRKEIKCRSHTMDHVPLRKIYEAILIHFGFF